MDFLSKFDFKHVRDYEIATTRALSREYILSFVEGENAATGEMEGESSRPSKRARGAYYAPISNAQTLRKRRPRVRFPSTLISRALLTYDRFSLC